MITKRIGQSQSNVIPHIVPAPSGRRFQNNWRMRRRLRNPGRFKNNRLSDPYLTGNSQVNSFYGGRRYSGNRKGIQGAFEDEFTDTFNSLPPTPPR